MTTITDRASDLATMLAAVEAIRPTIEAGRANAEANRRLDDAVYAALIDSGLMAMSQPRAVGGGQAHPVDLLQMWEAVARIDPAAAWNLLMNSSAPYVGAWLNQAGLDLLFADGPTTLAGSFNPPGAGTRVEGGWRVTAQMSFCSGIHHAQWGMLLFVHMDGGEPVIDAATGQPVALAAVIPRSDFTVIDTWHTLGMRGTGSADLAISDLFIPDHQIFSAGPLTNPSAPFAVPASYLFPLLLVMGESIVSVAVAAEAVSMLQDLAATKAATFTASTLRDRELIQYFAGKALSRVNAARVYLHKVAGDAFDEVSATSTSLTNATKIEVQLACSFAADACAEAVRLVHEAAGTSGIRIEAGFERLFRDAHTLTQHASKQSVRYASVGRLLFDLPNDWIFLGF